MTDRVIKTSNLSSSCFMSLIITDVAATIKQKLHYLAFPPVLREDLKWLWPGLQVTDFSVLRIF